MINNRKPPPPRQNCHICRQPAYYPSGYLTDGPAECTVCHKPTCHRPECLQEDADFNGTSYVDESVCATCLEGDNA